MYHYPVVFLFGLVGNLLAFLVFSRSFYRNTFFDVYFRAIALNDTLIIFNSLVDFLNYQYHISMGNLTLIFCQLRVYLLYVLPATTGWLCALIVFYRFMDVMFPTSFRFRNKKLIQLVACFVILVVCLLFYLRLPLNFIRFDLDHLDLEIANTSNISNISSYHLEFICVVINDENLFLLDLIFSTIAPFVLMTLCIMTVCSLLLKRKLKGIKPVLPPSLQLVYCRVALSLDLTFLLLNFPLRLLRIVYSDQVPDILGKVAILIWYCNYSTSFYINVLVNSPFRQQLREIITTWTKRANK